MGSLFGGLTGGSNTSSSGSSNNTSTQLTGPAPFQAPYISNQFQQAMSDYSAAMQNGPYQGQLYAPVNSQQYGAADNYANYANTSGLGLLGSGANGISNIYGAVPQFTQTAQNIASNGIQPLNSSLMNTLTNYGTGAITPTLVNSGLSSALNSAAMNGANSISSLQNNFGNIANQALANPTSQITANANQYVNNPTIQAQINATNANIANTLNQQTLPGLNQEAAMGGDLNSSRAGAAQAEAQGQAALAEGTADASIQNNAYNTGINTASSLYENGLNTALNASTSGVNSGLNTALGTANLQNNEGQFTTTNQLNAANSALNNQLSSEVANANTQLNANNQIGSSLTGAAFGLGGLTNAATGDYTLAANPGNYAQANLQGYDNQGYQQFTNNYDYPWQTLSTYASLVDNPSYTQTSGSSNTNQSSTQTQNSSPGILGAISGFGSLLGGASGGAGGLGSILGILAAL